MAINLQTDSQYGVLAILMNETLFNIAAPTLAQIEAQIAQIRGNIPYFRQFASATASEAQIQTFAEIKAFEQLVGATLSFPQFAGMSKFEIAKQAFTNINGAPPSDAAINSLLTAYNGNVAILIANIIVQASNTPTLALAANTFLAQAANGTAVYGEQLIVFNHAPTDIVDSADGDHTLSVVEHSAAGAVVGILKTADSDLPSDTHSYSIVGGSALFQINAAGEISVRPGASDQLLPGSYVLSIKSTDAGGASVTKDITVTVTLDPVLHTFVLTTGVDALQGTASDDLFLSNGITALTGGDNINGGAGNDTLRVNATLVGGLVGGFTMTGVETIEASLSGPLAVLPLQIQMTGVTGAQHLVVKDSPGNVVFQDIRAGFLPTGDATIMNSTGNVTYDFRPDALAGANDKLKVNLDGAGTAANPTNITFSQNNLLGPTVGAALETVALNTQGTASVIADINPGLVAPGINTLEISGNQDLTIGDQTAPVIEGLTDTLTGLNQINASALNANLNIAITDEFGDYDGSYTGAAGNDSVYVGDALLDGVIGQFNGGAGNNTIVFADEFSVPNGGDLNFLTNFQNAAFNNVVGVFDGQLDAQHLDGVRNYEFRSGVTTLNVVGLQANQSHQFTIGNNAGIGAATLRFDVGLNDTGAQPSNGDGANDSVTIVNQDANLALTVESNEIDHLTYVKANGGGLNVLTFSAEPGGQVWEDLKTLTLTSNDGGTIRVGDDSGAAITPNLSVIDGSGLGNTSLDMRGADGVAGNANDLQVAFTGATITGGNAGDFLIGSAFGTNTINGGGGNDILMGGGVDDFLNGGTGADLINGNGGDDIIDGGAGGDRMDGDGGADNFVISQEGLGNLNSAAGIDVIGDINDTSGAAIVNGGDFVTGTDNLVFAGLNVGGTAANLINVTGAGVLTYLDAIGAVNTAFAANTSLVYAQVTLSGANLPGNGDAGVNSTFVFADTNGDHTLTAADSVVQLVGVGAIAAGDIIANA
ncbi:MAG: beta strand repeat-containing protein [Hyphomicrobiaceae bacterium]